MARAAAADDLYTGDAQTAVDNPQSLLASIGGAIEILVPLNSLLCRQPFVTQPKVAEKKITRFSSSVSFYYALRRQESCPLKRLPVLFSLLGKRLVVVYVVICCAQSPSRILF